MNEFLIQICLVTFLGFDLGRLLNCRIDLILKVQWFLSWYFSSRPGMDLDQKLQFSTEIWLKKKPFLNIWLNRLNFLPSFSRTWNTVGLLWSWDPLIKSNFLIHRHPKACWNSMTLSIRENRVIHLPRKLLMAWNSQWIGPRDGVDSFPTSISSQSVFSLKKSYLKEFSCSSFHFSVSIFDWFSLNFSVIYIFFHF